MAAKTLENMTFKKFISENHPDPDTLLGENYEQLCLLAERFAERKIKEIIIPIANKTLLK